MDKIINIVSVSSGKDSTATMLLALEKHDAKNCRFVFADTGNEHEEVYLYLDYLENRLNIKIDRLKADFTQQIKNKRMFIARDQRIKRKNGKKIRWSNKRKREALELLKPTGNPYLDLCLWKGRFPSRRAQFCTQYLKTELLNRYINEFIDNDFVVISWQGIRRDESANRANVLQLEIVDEYFWQYRPIADWTAEKVFDYIKTKNVKPNPLYKMGMNRVGCMPCINARKEEIREISVRFPEEINRIASWEKIVKIVSKRNGATFFANTTKNPLDLFDIHEKVKWSKTKHGGKEPLIFDEESIVCKSSYGLCE